MYTCEIWKHAFNWSLWSNRNVYASSSTRREKQGKYGGMDLSKKAQDDSIAVSWFVHKMVAAAHTELYDWHTARGAY